MKLLLKSSYRVVLERGDEPRLREPGRAIEPGNHANRGRGVSHVGHGVRGRRAAVVPGLNERDDHEVARAAMA